MAEDEEKDVKSEITRDYKSATRISGGPATPRKGAAKFKQRQTRQFKSKPPKKGVSGYDYPVILVHISAVFVHICCFAHSIRVFMFI